MKRAGTILLVFCIAAATGAPAHSQVLVYSRGTRNIGMGEAGTADLAAPVNGYYNPAALAWANGVYLEASYNKLLEQLKYTDMRITAGGSKGNILFGGLVGYSSEALDIDCTYFADPVECDRLNYYLSGAAAVGRRMGNYSIGLGVAFKHVEEYTVAYTSFDMGAIASWSVTTQEGYALRATIGTCLKNIGKDIEYFSESDPIEQFRENRFGFGMDISTPPHASASRILGRDVPGVGVRVLCDQVRGSSELGFYLKEASGFRFGFEASLFETLYVRTGSRSTSYTYDSIKYSYLGFGIGYRHPQNGIVARLDYARKDYPARTDEFYGENKYDHVYGLVLGKMF